MSELDDEKVRKNDILSNREKSQRMPGQSLDSKGVQVDEYKDNPANRRPSSDESTQPDVAVNTTGTAKPLAKTEKPQPKGVKE